MHSPFKIDLRLSVFPWVDFCATKGAVKLHVGLNHNRYLPEFAVITVGKTSDVEIGRALASPIRSKSFQTGC